MDCRIETSVLNVFITEPKGGVLNRLKHVSLLQRGAVSKDYNFRDFGDSKREVN